MNIRAYLRKYFIMGSQNCPKHQTPENILRQAIDGGITAFQYREKGEGSLEGDEKIILGKKLRSICQEANIPFIINDDIELIEELKVDGIHVGQDDTPVETLRNSFPNLIIGLSVSNKDELKRSNIDLIDYVGAGAVFTTATKKDATQAVGLQWIETLRKEQPDLPIVGIGGINEDNAHQVIDAGADGVAVISAITQANNITKVVQAL